MGRPSCNIKTKKTRSSYIIYNLTKWVIKKLFMFSKFYPFFVQTTKTNWVSKFNNYSFFSSSFASTLSAKNKLWNLLKPQFFRPSCCCFCCYCHQASSSSYVHPTFLASLELQIVRGGQYQSHQSHEHTLFDRE